MGTGAFLFLPLFESKMASKTLSVLRTPFKLAACFAPASPLSRASKDEKITVIMPQPNRNGNF